MTFFFTRLADRLRVGTARGMIIEPKWKVNAIDYCNEIRTFQVWLREFEIKYKTRRTPGFSFYFDISRFAAAGYEIEILSRSHTYH